MAVVTGSLERALPLVHLAVLCAEDAYKKEPFGTIVDTNVRRIVISSHIQPNGCIIVVAIPGTQSFKDWKVNLGNLPCTPHAVLVSLQSGNCVHMLKNLRRTRKTSVTLDF